MKTGASQPEPGVRGPWRAAVFLLFLASGATGLVLEVAWTRLLTPVFGATVFAASTVLASFMLGLAVGSAWWGKRADGHARPLRLYGLLELMVGAYAWLFPWISAGLGRIYEVFYQTADPGFALMTAVRAALSMLVLLPPTICMGGTLPVLTRHLAATGRTAGREAGLLYAVNTFGAMAGCAVAGFVLLEWLGVTGTLWLAGSVALAIGAAAVWLAERAGKAEAVAARTGSARVEPGPPRQKAGSDPDKAAAGLGVFAVAFALSGFGALAAEVLWTRVLLFMLTTTVYAFAIMLTTFLVGNALGAAISARWVAPRVKDPLGAFALCQSALGLAMLGSVWALARLPEIELNWLSGATTAASWRYLVNYFLDALVVMGLPTVLMGLAFPLMTTAALRQAGRVGARMGRLYAANTVGCVAGSLAAGFLLLPGLGAYRSLALVAGLQAGLGAWLKWRSRRPSPTPGLRLRWLATAAIVPPVVALFGPADAFHATLNAYHAPSRLVFVREHATGTVTVHDLPNGDRLISVDGVDVAGRDFMLRTTQKLQGYLPLLLHPRSQRVAQIGFGCGETARVGLELGVPEYTVIEICPAVFEAGDFFQDLNHGSHRDPRIRRVIMDGKNFMRLTDEKFDVIMNDSIYPGSSGSSSLYTVDHFRACRERLREGGLFSCWVPLDLRPDELRMILRSFLEVFPHSSFWVASNCVNKNGVIIGTLEPLRIDFQRLKARLAEPAVRADLEAIAMADVYDFLDCHMMDAEAIGRFVGDAPLNSDEHPLLEFSCARKLPWTLRLRLALAALTAHRAPVTPVVTHFEAPERDTAELRRRFEATTHIFRAQIAQLALLPRPRRQELDAALAACPGELHVRTLEEELERSIRDLERLREQYPDNRVILERLADKYYVALRFEPARRLYRQLADSRPPPSPMVFVHLAEIEFNLGQPAAAEETLRRGLRFWPHDPELHDRLAGVCLRTGRLDLARRHIAEARRLAPDNPIYRDHEQAIRRAAQSGIPAR